jgi:hypothetical protein
VLPAQQLALSTSLDPRVPVGSYSAAARTRPNASQVAGTCAVLSTLMPELFGDGRCAAGEDDPSEFVRRGLSLSAAAVHPPETLARDGKLGHDAFNRLARELYLPFSDTSELSLMSSSSRSQQSPLQWGAGSLPRAVHSASAVRVVQSSIALDVPAAPFASVNGSRPGLFFNANAKSSGPLGPVADVARRRYGAYFSGAGDNTSCTTLMPRGDWEVLGVHVSLAYDASGPDGKPVVLMSIAETAVARAAETILPGLSPSGGCSGSTAMGMDATTCDSPSQDVAAGISAVIMPDDVAAADVFAVTGDSHCLHAHLSDGPVRRARGRNVPLPASSFTASALELCSSASRIANANKVGVIQAWLGLPYENSSLSAGAASTESAVSSASICRELKHAGLHRELEYQVDVVIPLAPLRQRRSDSMAAPPLCEVALVQRLEATQ